MGSFLLIRSHVFCVQILEGMLVWRTAESTSLSQCSESGGLRVVVLEFCASRLFYSFMLYSAGVRGRWNGGALVEDWDSEHHKLPGFGALFRAFEIATMSQKPWTLFTSLVEQRTPEISPKRRGRVLLHDSKSCMSYPRPGC